MPDDHLKKTGNFVKPLTDKGSPIRKEIKEVIIITFTVQIRILKYGGSLISIME